MSFFSIISVLGYAGYFDRLILSYIANIPSNSDVNSIVLFCNYNYYE